jgi:hypothetical protein
MARRKKAKTAVMEIVHAGDSLFVRNFHDRKQPVTKGRAPTQGPSTKRIREANDRAAVRRLAIQLNDNFRDGDWHHVLTYRGEPPTPELAKKQRVYFQRKLNTKCKALGIPAKWIAVTEWDNERIHHHLVVPREMDEQTLRDIWPYGAIRPTALWSNGDYRALAEYLIKETSKHFRKKNAVYKRRWTASRAITMPESYREPIAEDDILDPPIPTGWYRDEESYYEAVNPETGRVYSEYVLLPLRPASQFRKRRGAKAARPLPVGHLSWLKRNAEVQREMMFTPDGGPDGRGNE